MEKSKGIKSIIDAIESKRSLCNSEIKKIQESTIDELQKMFTKNLDELSIDDITNLSTSQCEKIIKLLNLDVNHFDFTLDSGYNELLQNIIDYTKLNNDRCSAFKKTIEKCDKYEELLTSNQNLELFTDLKDFHNFIDSLGLGDAEKLVAERTLADYYSKLDTLDPELTQNVFYVYSVINKYPDIIQIINKYKTDNKLKVDLNFVENESKKIADAFSKSYEVVNFVLNGMLLGQEYKKYIASKDVIHLTRCQRILNNFRVDEMNLIIDEANSIIRNHVNELSVKNIEYRDIQITDSSSYEEFENKKHEKLLEIANLIKNQISDYENSSNKELKEDYKNNLRSYIDEYNFTNELIYQERTEGKTL